MNPQNNQSIFQILISESATLELPNGLAKCVNSIKACSNGLNHFLLNGEKLHEIIEHNFENEVINSYLKLVPYAYKADLARYCLLYLYGGWYFDISVSVNSTIPHVSGVSHVVFRDAPHPNCNSWDASNAVIYAEKGSPIMESAITQIVANCKSNWYGTNALCPTGPGVLGRALAIHGADHSIITGMLMTLTPEHKYKNNAFVLPDGEILAWGKKTWGNVDGDGLHAFGAVGTNSYSMLYNQRNIYNQGII